ncbi:MAG: type II toxin-antitoxin system RelE/ParE family toxin [Syntrophorhabdales bacterium]
MAWRVEWEDEAVKEIKKLDARARRNIVRFLREKIATEDDPRRFGDPLRKELKGLWKYRIGDYRIICSIEDKRVVVLVVRVGHRSCVYK